MKALQGIASKMPEILKNLSDDLSLEAMCLAQGSKGRCEVSITFTDKITGKDFKVFIGVDFEKDEA